MVGSRVYIHELVDIIGHNRAAYMHHMTANWGPVGRRERNQLCFGVWATVGSTGRWPQVVNLWEYEDWTALGRNFEIELRGAGLQDPSLQKWWAAAAEFRSGGFDRILVAPEWSPSIAQHCAEITAGRAAPAAYAHELVGCRAGSAMSYLDRVRIRIDSNGRDEHGRRLIGAFARAMADDDECIVIWSFDSWSGWSAFEEEHRSAHSAEVRDRDRDIVTSFERFLMSDAPLSPLRTGSQPGSDDGPL